MIILFTRLHDYRRLSHFLHAKVYYEVGEYNCGQCVVFAEATTCMWLFCSSLQMVVHDLGKCSRCCRWNTQIPSAACKWLQRFEPLQKETLCSFKTVEDTDTV